MRPLDREIGTMVSMKSSLFASHSQSHRICHSVYFSSRPEFPTSLHSRFALHLAPAFALSIPPAPRPLLAQVSPSDTWSDCNRCHLGERWFEGAAEWALGSATQVEKVDKLGVGGNAEFGASDMATIIACQI